MSTKVVEMFNQKTGEEYDKNNASFTPIFDNLHFLSNLILDELPKNAKLLCVGVGTGSEIIKMAESHPQWSFFGIEPSISMLKGCKEKMVQHGLDERCEFFNGYLSEWKSSTEFDAVLCHFVMHFVQDLQDRKQMFEDMAKHLNPRGILINSEICFDTSLAEFSDIADKWNSMHALSGKPKMTIESLKEMFSEHLMVLPPLETEKLILESGFSQPISFFQSLLIRAWYSRKAL